MGQVEAIKRFSGDGRMGGCQVCWLAGCALKVWAEGVNGRGQGGYVAGCDRLGGTAGSDRGGDQRDRRPALSRADRGTADGRSNPVATRVTSRVGKRGRHGSGRLCVSLVKS